MAVVDANVIVKAFAEEPQSELATKLFESAEILEIPAHALAEVGEVLVRKRAVGQLAATQLSIAIRSMIVRLRQIPLSELLPAATELAETLKISVYDALYLECARYRNAILLTQDLRLILRTRGTPFESLALTLEQHAAR